MMGMLLPDLSSSLPSIDIFDGLQGRVIDRILWSYDEPDGKSKRKKLYWHDLVLGITNTTISSDETAYNRVWYEVEDGGYVYSGSIQPVRTVLNEPQLISLKGALGEVSVPFTDAHLEADSNSELIYRLYHETVHWVTASAVLPDGSIWYALLDDKFEQQYFTPAKHIRIFLDNDLTPLSTNIPNEEKRIEVRLDDQLVLAFERERLVFATRTATGGRLRSGTYTTPTGDYITYHQRHTRHMAAGDLASSGFDLPGVPWVTYIKENGISFHGTYWHNDYGRPRSHGCINLTPQAAKWLYRWSTPSVPMDTTFIYGHVGTRVDIIEWDSSLQ
jgi:lipoprotein-anchoring transpeptidase ErfK/SrfK